MKVLVLGCGPSGLAAVHAVKQTAPHAEVVVLSKKRKSQMFGAQFLHAPIPNLPEEVGCESISYRLDGTPAGYREKVYGFDYRGTVSPEDLVGDHLGWDIRATYNQLWMLYGHMVRDAKLFYRSVFKFIIDDKYDLVINSVPRPSLCGNKSHEFKAQEIWAIGDAPELGIQCPITLPRDNMVICNGYPFPSWYRASRIFNHTTTEWPLEALSDVNVGGAAKVQKPVSTDCDCWPWDKTKMLHVGRYGAWQKGYLVHHAYEAVVDTISTLSLWGCHIIDPNDVWPLV